jgi:hypothetical protein
MIYRVSLLVSQPGCDYQDELIDGARCWFGKRAPLEFVGEPLVEVAECDRNGRPYAWRMTADIRCVDESGQAAA